MRESLDSDWQRKLAIAKLMLLGNSCNSCCNLMMSSRNPTCFLTEDALQDPYLNCCEYWKAADARSWTKPADTTDDGYDAARP